MYACCLFNISFTKKLGILAVLLGSTLVFTALSIFIYLFRIIIYFESSLRLLALNYVVLCRGSFMIWVMLLEIL